MSFTCSLTNCQNIESLPFHCKDCNSYYCRKHYSSEKHNCSKKNVKTYRYISENESIEICNQVNCNSNEDLKICNNCNQKYCYKHTSPWHNCVKTNTDKRSNFIECLKSCFCLK